MLNLIKRIPVLLYDFIISTFLTISAHLAMINYMHLSSGNFLDVGCGTGAPLKAIIKQIQQFHQKIVGVDMHAEYSAQAMKIFQGDENVEIYNLNFYNIKEYIQLKYRFIFFSFSFMLMPDPGKALALAKELLQKNENSRIAFILTLNKNRNSFLNRIKPFIRRLTTIDFGQVVYEDSFLQIIENNNLQIVKKIRIEHGWNLFLKIFPVYYVETRLRQ